MAEKKISLSWETDSQLQGKEVCITLSWERFKRLREEGTLDGKELAKMEVEGRISVHGALETQFVRPRPKFLPGNEQKSRKRPRSKPTAQMAGGGESVGKQNELQFRGPLPIGSSRHTEPRQTRTPRFWRGAKVR